MRLPHTTAVEEGTVGTVTVAASIEAAEGHKAAATGMAATLAARHWLEPAGGQTVRYSNVCYVVYNCRPSPVKILFAFGFKDYPWQKVLLIIGTRGYIVLCIKLNQMGESWLQNKKNSVDFVTLICIVEMH